MGRDEGMGRRWMRGEGLGTCDTVKMGDLLRCVGLYTRHNQESGRNHEARYVCSGGGKRRMRDAVKV